jgi:hypothetical protein
MLLSIGCAFLTAAEKESLVTADMEILRRMKVGDLLENLLEDRDCLLDFQRAHLRHVRLIFS